ncbi:hypothetical protein E0485_18955 [Paenibacillus albiflavus]|uniref:SLH domain-containing protein n=1 Tax=Paenibacillus albiflavus TaxID=2545760 RepID=A0A4R4E6E7_9BACL|nr:S-layer homology domain-containing protein [Paenibacillus albiflavus]TCZ75069.1 hypothetical protein E0485_18955 [Paenibacillus albiflavus]
MKFKRLIIPVLIMCLLLNVPMYALAKEDTETKLATIQLEYKGKSVIIGKEVTVDVVVSNVTDLYGVQLQVHYDTSKFALKSASANSKFDDFNGITMEPDEGTVSLPLLRKNLSSLNSNNSSFTIAKLEFTALSAGEADLSIQGLKAVSSKTYVNENGFKDLVELDITIGKDIAIQIINPSTSPGTDISTGSDTSAGISSILNQSLKDLEKKLAANNPEQAMIQLSSLLSSGTSKFSNAEIKKLEELMSQLQQQLENSVVSTLDSSTNTLKLESSSLAKAVKALENLSLLAARNKLNLPSGKEIHVKLLNNESSSLHISAEQAKLLNQNKVSLLLERAQGSVMIPSDVLMADKPTVIQLTAATVQGEQQTDAHLQFVTGLNFQILTTTGENATIPQSPGQFQLSLNYDASSSNAHKLGVYVWNKTTSTWDYVRSAKQENGKFEFVTDKPGIYAVMEYSANYTDIDKVYKQAKLAIELLSAKHYMYGTEAGKFSPQQEITRAEFIALLVRILELQSVANDGDSFNDVESNAWYAGEINAAKKAGIVQGDGSNFNPNGTLTREAMAVMLVNAGLLQADPATTNEFADDASISDWAKDAVYKAKASGLIVGVGSNTLQAKSSANRADVAVILLRLIEQQ